jgi:hypothetical protein
MVFIFIAISILFSGAWSCRFAKLSGGTVGLAIPKGLRGGKPGFRLF